MENILLPKRQFEVMKVLWKCADAMTALEIKNISGLGINTVQACLRSLMEKEYINQAEIVYSGTVLARSYKPRLSEEDYLKTISCQIIEMNDRRLIVDALLRQITDIEVLDNLEEMVYQRRRILQKNERSISG